MRYELMLPHQIRKAIKQRWPVVLPLGVLEYHGEHMSVGMDTLAVVKVLEIIEREIDVVVLPPFYYGASSYAVEPPEGNGSVHVSAEALLPFGKQLFYALLRVGFRNIHFFVHHQTENFAAGMPTDLAFKLAAREAIFEFLEKERGEGWWGDEKMADYASDQATGNDPFNWIKGHPLFTAEMVGQYPLDHAGQGETSLMLTLCPEAVDMGRLATTEWYTRTARQASAPFGANGRDMVLANMRKIFAIPTAPPKKSKSRRAL